ncbi:four-carbon acid sugar kinase family protein [Brenneria goodwinii]|uniref:3-oxo-tetronate kinase n=1 Tax=Brenneria goodwinii TaxID=1109412 RepID=A0A0G4JSL4_9GAMM|nr:3-oxo-tetronate kinase [Brenneria goodwinii]MCG8155984.1 four-carbon acid sugar kinase family protein [Brenneria goodwinii]MCG8161826.1 four-carbon acid sugar kinase family protein [Brenneria goodwinii]MCG8166443.1 four-carbon acid sugar kinase family protein [Brenneria goodwinii]MCG8169576.1 four-carbon acid sugar kinase family protein [Brenneria goodwinii]MCG8174819.1 four-carbon acid sugar kinase family protein [Brenneria goodwinii]
MLLGVIADDFTGATDIAGFLAGNGLSTVQLNGVPPQDYHVDAQAAVISLKSRSCPPEQAVADSLNALAWLQVQGCRQFYFKYCSTFDSTAQGNIGPVTDALLDALGETQTVISPALPVNGRTVYQGYLFVMDRLLSESGMRDHPLTPMTDSYLPRLMERQAEGKCGVIAADVMDRGVEAVAARLAELRRRGVRYAALDALNGRHLLVQGEALRGMKLVTGGSGLAIGLARQWATGDAPQDAQAAGAPQGGPAIVLSGSCSVMTNRQVARYLQQASGRAIDVERCMAGDDALAGYARELCDWVRKHSGEKLAPMLYATAEPEILGRIQQRWGAQASSQAVEALFSSVARQLREDGFRRFIVAGGETSSIVVQTLGIRAFHIGPTISPGVPWVRSTDAPLSLALKSGNFGDENFFARAQQEFVV